MRLVTVGDFEDVVFDMVLAARDVIGAVDVYLNAKHACGDYPSDNDLEVDFAIETLRKLVKEYDQCI